MEKKLSKSAANILKAMRETAEEMLTLPRAFTVATPATVAGFGWLLNKIGHSIAADPRHVTLGLALGELGHWINEGGSLATGYTAIDNGKDVLTTFKDKSKIKKTNSAKKKTHRPRTPQVVINQVVIQQPVTPEQIAPVINQAIINPAITAPATTQPVIDMPVTSQSLGWGHKHHEEPSPRNRRAAANNSTPRAARKKTHG